MSGAPVEQVLTLTLEKRPLDATHWQTRSMAKRSGLNQRAVTHIWHALLCNRIAPATFQLFKGPTIDGG